MGKSSGDQTVTQKWEPPSFVANLLPGAAQQGYNTMEQYANNMPVFTGQRVADINGTQLSAIQGLTNQVYANPFGTQTYNAFNSLVGNPTAVQGQRNQYAGMQNQYGGASNPAFEDMLSRENKDITDAYGRGTAAQTDAAAASSGAFGGSAYQSQVSQNQKDLADRLAQNESGQRSQQYNNAANLEQQRIGSMQQLEQQYLGTQNQNQSDALTRQLQGLGLFPQINQAALNNYQALFGAGDTLRQAQQQYLDGQQQQWYDQAFGPAQGTEMLMNILRGYGGLGGTSTMQSSPGRPSPIGAGLGGLLAAGSMFGG